MDHKSIFTKTLSFSIYDLISNNQFSISGNLSLYGNNINDKKKNWSIRKLRIKPY